jgi:hypothetical protein
MRHNPAADAIIVMLRNLKMLGMAQAAAADLTIVRPAAAAPPRRPEQVELPRWEKTSLPGRWRW